jgi:hypothetical protein
MRKHLLPFVAIGVVAVARAAFAQPAPGGEFLVNSGTTNSQTHPKVARQFGSPGFIVVWEGYTNGSFTWDIYAAAFNNLGIKQVADFIVNTYQTHAQSYPAVAGEYDGTFTVTWESVGQNESGNYGIYAQRLSSSGTQIGTELLVSTYTTGSQRHPSIAPGTVRRVVFEGQGETDVEGVFLSNDTFATQSRVNAYSTGSQKSASVSAGILSLPGAPNFIVVWSGNGVDDPDQGIYGHVFDSDGNSFGSDFRINTTTLNGQTHPAVAVDPFAIGYVVVWETANGGGTLRDVYGQRLEANGAPRGPEFRVNTYTTGNQDQPAVAVDDYGNFVVAWSSYQDGSMRSVHAQAFSAAGVPRGGEYRLNDFKTLNQRMPSVAATGEAEGKFVVVWQSFQQASLTSSEDVYARLFSVPLAGDADGNGKVDVNDVFYLINYLFAGGPSPMGAANVNGDGKVDVNDVFYLINYLFAGGPAPV